MIQPGDTYFIVMPTATGFTVEDLVCDDEREAETANVYNRFCYQEKADALCVAENLTNALTDTRKQVLQIS